MADDGAWPAARAAGRAAPGPEAGAEPREAEAVEEFEADWGDDDGVDDGPVPPLPPLVRYLPGIGASICGRVAAGESLMAICREAGLPHRTTIRDWVRRHPEFGEGLLAAQRQARVAKRVADRLRALKPPKKHGRKSSYTREWGEAVCERIICGETLRAIGRDPAMPCYSTIMNWARWNLEFQEMYQQAKALQADALFDETLDVVRAATPGNVWVARLQFDAFRWATARLAPKKYVERLAIAQFVAEAKAAEAEGAAGKGVVRILVTSFERSPKDPQKIIAFPPRNPQEEADYIEAYGEPYSGPDDLPPEQDWRYLDAHRDRRNRVRAQLGIAEG